MVPVLTLRILSPSSSKDGGTTASRAAQSSILNRGGLLGGPSAGSGSGMPELRVGGEHVSVAHDGQALVQTVVWLMMMFSSLLMPPDLDK